VVWTVLRRFRRVILCLVVVAGLLGAGAVVRLDSVHPAQARTARLTQTTAAVGRISAARTPDESGHWVATWGAAPQAATPGNLSLVGFQDQTVRQIVFVSGGGSMVRIELSNTFGSTALEVGGASVALDASGTTRALTFAGQSSVVIPPGAEVLSDPVPLTVPALSRLAVSLYLPVATGPVTQHVQARQVNYVAGGDRVLQDGPVGFDTQTQSWYLLAGVDVLAPARDAGTIVALGDSITDGVGSTLDGDDRWPNDLAERLAALTGTTMSVVDEGIGGNRVLNDSACCGVDAVARFERDVAAQPGVRDVILLEGINDIGFSQSDKLDNEPHTDVSALQIIDGYEQIIAMAHADGLKIYGATLTPFAGARYWTPAGEAKRDAINRWIETSGAFNGVINFAAAVADPNDPEELDPAYDSGDHLHPNAAGYRAMAKAIDLAMLVPGH